MKSGIYFPTYLIWTALVTSFEVKIAVGVTLDDFGPRLSGIQQLLHLDSWSTSAHVGKFKSGHLENEKYVKKELTNN